MKSSLNTIPEGAEYVGWVPCISGYLYFEFANCGLGEEVYADVKNIELDLESGKYYRYIVISSKVNWKDDKSINLDGKYRVLLMASGTLEADSLVGMVFVVPSISNAWEMAEVGETLYEIRRLTEEQEDIGGTFNKLQHQLTSILSGTKMFVTHFILKRSGLTFLRFGDKPDSELNSQSDTAFIVTRQSYYYIKNTFHRHSHHHHTAESLTTTWRLSASQTGIGMMLINDLKRSLVQLKRDFHISEYRLLFSARGIMSYAKSLILSCKKEGLLSEDEYKTEKSYIENMVESLDVSATRIQADINRNEAFSADYRAIILFFLAIFTPFTVIFGGDIAKHISEKPNRAIVLVSRIVENEVYVGAAMALTVVSFFLIRMLVLKYGTILFAIQKIGTIFEFLLHGKRNAHIVFSIVILFAVIIIYFSLSLLYQYGASR